MRELSFRITGKQVMIVVGLSTALIATTAFALPAYQKKAMEIMVAHCISTATLPQLLISKFHQREGRWPTSFSEASFYGPDETVKTHSKHCAGLSYGIDGGNGEFTIAVIPNSFSVPSDVVLEPKFEPRVSDSGEVSWTCSSGWTTPEYVQLLPSACRPVMEEIHQQAAL